MAIPLIDAFKVLRSYFGISRRSSGGCRFWLMAAVALVVTMLGSKSYAANPFITSIYTADPSAHVWADGRLYVYASHDMDPPRGCDLMDRYHVFSTDDMANWRDEGEILRASQVPWGRKEGGFMWAPDCAFRNGTYYFYYPRPSGTDWNDTWKIGVATSTQPASGFRDVGYIEGLAGFAMIDPAVFVDGDNEAYIYFGGGGHCKGTKLKGNMTELAGPLQEMTGLVDFHEAAWVFRRQGIYYLSYADNHPEHNEMRYATSTNALGPWTYKGVYLKGTDCDTTHGSVVEYQGQWYQFYHNSSISGQGNLRSMCVDKLNFNADGMIQTMVQTKTGPVALMENPGTVRLEAANAVTANGAQLEDAPSAAGGKSVHGLDVKNASLQFDGVGCGQGGRISVAVHYATAEKARLRLFVNGEDYSFINMASTGGWDNYTGQAFLTVPLGAGNTNSIRLLGGSGGVNVDYVTLTPLDRR